MTDLENLKKLAEAATPGKWANEDEECVITTLEQPGADPFPVVACFSHLCVSDTLYKRASNAEFVAACSPDVILKLIREVEKQKPLYQEIERLMADNKTLIAKVERYRRTIQLIHNHARTAIISTEEECDMSANWVERRCRQALEDT